MLTEDLCAGSMPEQDFRAWKAPYNDAPCRSCPLQGYSNLIGLLNQPRAIVLPAFEAASAVENKLALVVEAVQSE